MRRADRVLFRIYADRDAMRLISDDRLAMDAVARHAQRKGRFAATLAALIVAALLVGCVGGEPAMPPSDGPTCTDDLCEVIGELCSPGDRSSQWCADHTGWCVSGVCRPFCSAVHWPRCEAGTVEQHSKDSGGADICVCVPGTMSIGGASGWTR